MKTTMLLGVFAWVLMGDGSGVSAQGPDAKREIARLREEIAELRRELEAAVKEIQQLKGNPNPTSQAKSQSPRFRGRTLQFWLDQFQDADEKYRIEAVEALGVLAHKNKEVIPTLLVAIKDPSSGVGNKASQALAALGKEVVPALSDLVKDEKSPKIRSRAIVALREMGSEAGATVPILIQVLNEEDGALRPVSISALRAIGPDAKPALPVLIRVLGLTLQDLRVKALQEKNKPAKPWDRASYLGSQYLAEGIVSAVLAIDPESRALIPEKLPGLESEGLRSGQWLIHRPDHMALWQEAHDALKKKYFLEK